MASAASSCRGLLMPCWRMSSGTSSPRKGKLVTSACVTGLVPNSVRSSSHCRAASRTASSSSLATATSRARHDRDRLGTGPVGVCKDLLLFPWVVLINPWQAP
jgi:hypothetical protein